MDNDSHYETFHSMRYKCFFVSPYLFISLFLKQLVGDELSSTGNEAGVARARFTDHLEMSCGSLFSRQMPFLQLLQGAMQAEEEMVGKQAQLHLQHYQQRSLSTSNPQETNFQLHQMRTQSLKQQRTTEMDSSPAAEQLESCITHLSESETRTVAHELPTMAATTGLFVRSAAATCSGERKKRTRRRPASASKSAEKEESQRMTHIAVERNRRRLMNYHLTTLRSLMPPSFVQRVRTVVLTPNTILPYVSPIGRLRLPVAAFAECRATRHPSSVEPSSS